MAFTPHQVADLVTSYSMPLNRTVFQYRNRHSRVCCERSKAKGNYRCIAREVIGDYSLLILLSHNLVQPFRSRLSLGRPDHPCAIRGTGSLCTR